MSDTLDKIIIELRNVRDFYRDEGVDEFPEMSTREVRDAFNDAIEIVEGYKNE